MRGHISYGEKAFGFAVVAMVVMSACFAHHSIARYLAAPSYSVPFTTFGLWSFVAGGLGGLAGFFSCYSAYFGFDGVMGTVRACLGGLLMTGLATVVAGTLILPYYGTMFGPFQFIIALIETPLLAFCWGAMLTCLHKLVQIWRRERDSIFNAKQGTLRPAGR